MNAIPSAAENLLQDNSLLSRPVLPGVIYPVPVSVNGKQAAVKGFYEYYPNNIRISLRQLSLLFRETERPFSVSETEDGFSVITGETETGTDTPVTASLRSKERICLMLNGRKVRYPSTVTDSGNGKTDIFLNPADIAMMIDADIAANANGIAFRADKPFSPELEKLGKEKYFQNVNAVSVADLSKDTVYFEKDAGQPFPIASISKLMTVLIVLDEIGTGKLSMTDSAAVSVNAEALSLGEDAMIRLDSGKPVTISELLYATLVCSSNECALVLAETVSGSEEAFVLRMRKKASELGMCTAEFVNCHGLPHYTNSWAAAKIQNRVSAEDLIILTKTLLNNHPEIISLTSAKEVKLPSLGLTVHSTNPLLYNVESVNGFKTGSTNKAGSCLITTVCKNQKYGAVVLLGAESSEECFRKSEIAVRYLLNKM